MNSINFFVILAVGLFSISCGDRERFTQLNTAESLEYTAKLGRAREVGLRIVNGAQPAFDSHYDQQFVLEHPFLTHDERINRLEELRNSASTLHLMTGQTYYSQVSKLCEARIALEKESRGLAPDSDFQKRLAQIQKARSEFLSSGTHFRVNLGSGRLVIEKSTSLSDEEWEKRVSEKAPSYISVTKAFLKTYGNQLAKVQGEKEITTTLAQELALLEKR